MDRYESAEFQLPPIGEIWKPAFRIPFIAYFFLFQFIGYCIRTYTWKSYSGFKQYRLRNLTVCIIHSCITGLWSLIFSIIHQKVILEDTIHWYRPWAAQIPILSMAYFLYDTIDMARHEISKWTIELIYHHIACIFGFSLAVLPRKFILYAYCGLLMEVNSIFLHLRSVMNISGYNVLKQNLYRIIQFTNIITFIIFRFVIQIWQINWVWKNCHRFHIFYTVTAFIGASYFLANNLLIFMRLLASDGYLGEFGRQHLAIGRDSQKSILITKNTKSS